MDDRRHRLDYLQQAGRLLIQQGTKAQALTVQGELDEFKLFSRTVLDRLAACRAALEALDATDGGVGSLVLVLSNFLSNTWAFIPS